MDSSVLKKLYYMKIKEKGNIVIIKRVDENPQELIQKITDQKKEFLLHHLVIDLNTYDLKAEEVLLFQTLHDMFKDCKKSFVIVVTGADFNELSEEITVVPTLQEAHDIIEMEEIERDLGF